MQDHRPGSTCLACKEARRQNKQKRLSQATDRGPDAQGSPPAALRLQKTVFVKTKSAAALHAPSSDAAEDGKHEGVAVAKKLDSPFSEASAQQQQPLESGTASDGMHDKVVCAGRPSSWV